MITLPSLVLMILLSSLQSAAPAQEHVILLHGLCRTSRSMAPMERALRDAGYVVSNIGYPSRSASIETLSERAIADALSDCRRDGARVIHFVTHSMGGILVRSYLARHAIPELGRVVMLAPPNQGSEVVDRIGHWKLFFATHGPAGRELSTAADSTPNQLGPATFSVGVIAGNRSLNWINSCYLPGPDDGKVSVERTRLVGMSDHLVIQATHTFIMNNREALRQTVSFLKQGTFDQNTAKRPSFIGTDETEVVPLSRSTDRTNGGMTSVSSG